MDMTAEEYLVNQNDQSITCMIGSCVEFNAKLNCSFTIVTYAINKTKVCIHPL